MKKFCLMTLVLSLGLWAANAASGVDCPVLVYQTDFATDQGWHTNNPHNYYLDCRVDAGPTGAYPTGAYYTKQINICDDPDPSGDGEYSYYDVGHKGGSFCLEWDTLVKSAEYARGCNFGLYASDLLQGSGYEGNFAHVSFIHEDRGYIARIDWRSALTGESSSDFSVPNQYQFDIWYHTIMEYDADNLILTANITERATGVPLALFKLTNVGPFATDMGYLGASSRIPEDMIPECCGPGCLSEAYYDNVVFSVPEPATICMLGLGVLGLLRKRRS